MRYNSDNPVILSSQKTLEMYEQKEVNIINALAKRFIRKAKDEIKNAIVHITYTDVYIQRYKKKKAKNKN